MPEATPVEEFERKKFRGYEVRNEANRREKSFMKVAVKREQDRIEWAEEEELAEREA